MNYEELDRALDHLGYTNPTFRKGIIELAHTLDAQPISDERERLAVAEVFTRLVRDYVDGSLVLKEKASKWVNFRLGDHRPGVTVRVRHDAYDSEAGSKHNGLVGECVGVRGGRVYVQYVGRTDGVGHAHHPYKIEVLEP